MTTKQAYGTALFVAAAVATGVAFSRKPWEVYNEQRKLAAEQRVEMRESEARRAELLREEARVKSSVGREQLAREHGFLKPGEEPADR